MADEYLKRDFKEEELVELAIKRLKVKRELITHIMSYVFVNVFLLLVVLYWNNFEFSLSIVSWNFWVLAGWGLGVFFHCLSAYNNLKFNLNRNALNNELRKINGEKKLPVDKDE